MNHEITVCIPSYNKELSIKRCIDSVIKQNEPVNIIVIDNKSTDNTRNIINSYGPEVKKIQNNLNLGMAGNRNRCIKECDTGLLMILHADDELLENSLKLYTDFYKKHPDVGMIHASSFSIYEKSKKKIKLFSDFKEKRTQGKDALNKLLGEPTVRCSSVVVPRKIYDKIGLYIEESLSSDSEMRCRIGKEYDIGYIFEPTVNIYIDDSSTGKSSLINRDLNDILFDREALSSNIISYYEEKDKKQAIKYKNHAIIVGLIIIIRTVFPYGQYKKVFKAIYNIIFVYTGLFNMIVIRKILLFPLKKLKSPFIA